MDRIVSLIPSATEIVCALGCEAQLVGRSHECDYPELVKRLPVCTEPKINPHGSSGEINNQIKAFSQETQSVYRVRKDLLKQLKPDCIVTQAQCEVCAVSLSEVERTVFDWGETRPVIVALSANTLGDVWADIKRVAEALGMAERGNILIKGIEQRICDISSTAETLPEQPLVACIEWIDPLMASANWMPELVSLAGGQNLFGESGGHSPLMTWESLLKADPDVLVLVPCGFDIARTFLDLPVLTQKPGWSGLKAVRAGKVFLADGQQYFNRSGPRLVDSLEILAEILHPSVYQFGYAGKGWKRL